MPKRFPELDLLRTLAILLMVIYHAAYDLQMFHGWNLDVLSGTWWWMARGTAALFLVLVGSSFAISWNRSGGNVRKYWRRGMLLLLFGMVVSGVTYLWEPETYVRFGILHLIGVSILILPAFAPVKEWTALIGVILIAGGLLLPSLHTETSLLLPLGIFPAQFDTVDYFPLLPWFGFVLPGFSIGWHFYVRRTPPVFSILHSPLSILLMWPGRHALLTYLLHQPLLLGILGLLGFFGFL